MNYTIKKQIIENTLFVLVFALILSSYCFCFGFLFNQKNDQNAVSTSIKTTERKCIVIDPGHGGEDGGTVGINGVLEKDLNLSLSKILSTILIFAGYDVVQTRTEDKLLYDKNSDYRGRKKILDLQGRLEMAQSIDPDIFIGIHMNSFPESKYSGLSVYYSKNDPSSQKAAELISSNVKSTLQPQNNREIKEATSNIYILNRINCPAILIECGFLSNQIECQKLSSYQYRQQLSIIFYSSLISFLEK